MEYLWKKIVYAKPEVKIFNKNDNQDEETDNPGFLSKLFCCVPKRPDLDGQIKKEKEEEEEAEKIEELEENLRFQDDDEVDSNYDNNMNFVEEKQKEEEKEEEKEKKIAAEEGEKVKESTSSCIIF